MSKSKKSDNRVAVALTILNTQNLLGGLCCASRELDRAVVGLPKSAHESHAYQRIQSIRKELKDITNSLNPTVFLEDVPSVDVSRGVVTLNVGDD